MPHRFPIPRWVPFLLVVALLPGCAKLEAPVRRDIEAWPPVLQPAPGSRRFAISAERSEVRILVYRAGPLAAFGHNHVIRAAGISGEVHLAPDFRRSVLAFRLPVRKFEVDPPAARAVEGEEFAAQPSDEAIAQTRGNLLGPAVLDAAHHPEIRVRSVRIVGPDWAPEVTLRIALRGAERELAVPVALEVREGELKATGTFSLSQREFGIEPFSILGGGLQVADQVKIRFRIVAAER